MTTKTDNNTPETNPETTHNGGREYPENADIILASRPRSERFYFKDPVGGVISVPALNAEQAQQLAADEFKGFQPEDFEQVDGFDVETADYPDPINSDRDVNEYDIWSLHHAQQRGDRAGISSYSPRKNPTENTIELLLNEWDEPTDIPLHDIEKLQQATKIGPHKAAQVIGAAVSNNLIERPTTHST